MAKTVKAAGKDAATAKGKTIHGSQYQKVMTDVKVELEALAENHSPRTNKGPGRRK